MTNQPEETTTVEVDTAKLLGPAAASPQQGRVRDPRTIIAGMLAGGSLASTVALIILGAPDAHIALLAGFTTTFGAYALGLESESRS